MTSKKLAVLTIAMGEHYQKLSKITHPTIKHYADKIGAEFIVIDQQKISQTTPHWEKFQIFNLLNVYDRILFIDTDIIIREDAPNIFDEVPDTELGLFNEAPWTDRSKELLIDTCKAYDTKLDGWDGKYYNSGVMVISRCHKHLFKKPDKEVFNFYEQTYLNMIFALNKPKIFDISYKFNRMCCLDRFLGDSRLDSYFVHYAGIPNYSLVLELVPRDIAQWKLDAPKYEYQKHILITVNGGLGDQIDAEPSIRFMKKHVYPDAHYTILCHWPRVFDHLREYGMEIYEHGKWEPKFDTAYYRTVSLPGPETINWMVVSNLMCHTVDYVSMALMKRTLPFIDRTINLRYSQKEVDSLKEMTGLESLKNLVVVHAGMHWEAKTMPGDWWQKLVDGLHAKGLPICLVGKGDDTRGVHDLIVRDGMIDLRERLDLGEFIAIIGEAKLLVSNDSSPVHIAGAFDNHIILLPYKHPDHTLPYRNCSVYHKAKAFYKKIVLDDFASGPAQVAEVSGANLPKPWDEYLPEIDEVVEYAERVFKEV